MMSTKDAERAVALLNKYQGKMASPGEQQLKASIGEVSRVLASDLFHALLDIQEYYQQSLLYTVQQNEVLGPESEITDNHHDTVECLSMDSNNNLTRDSEGSLVDSEQEIFHWSEMDVVSEVELVTVTARKTEVAETTRTLIPPRFIMMPKILPAHTARPDDDL